MSHHEQERCPNYEGVQIGARLPPTYADTTLCEDEMGDEYVSMLYRGKERIRCH
jgi:hypothetical protein